MVRYTRTEGILVEPVGDVWAAFSPCTGETVLLNHETASILEVLGEDAAGTAEICAVLAADCGLDADSLAEVVETCWPRLLEAGLVRERLSGHAYV
jgi:PqqD family protein of HPr-rel-A system